MTSIGSNCVINATVKRQRRLFAVLSGAYGTENADADGNANACAATPFGRSVRRKI
jgi:hypothetical protein